ncbi:MAG TPA: TetR/AcrR family transcriptional regulator [Steroidobacteraceae bacterium]|jgi:TetR/AcrR family transcriptional repressor of nem operon
MTPPPHESKKRLLEATLKVVRTKGYSATRIEDVCAEAGLTKGSFFHHFKSKEDLALAAAEYWRALSIETFAAAPYHKAGDALGRLLAYVDFRKALLTGDLPDFTCFAGTIVQEAYRTHPDVSAACARDFAGQIKMLEADIREAMRDHGMRAGWTAESLARHILTVTHGGFILAKAEGSATAAAESLDHLHRYIELLFAQGPQRRTGRASSQKH